jgi:transcriptional regulator with XRE-family HTH domain
MQRLIIETRHDLSLSLQDVADRACITKSHLWNLEQGRSVNPTIKTIRALADALSLPFSTVAQGAINDVDAKETEETKA